MKLIPIIMESVNNYDCFDLVIHAIGNWSKRDYRMIFSKSWGLTYESIRDGSNIISKNLFVDRVDRFYYLSKYHGIDIKKLDLNSDVASFIKEEINNNFPVLLKVDAFYCPWMFSHYKIQHGNHFLIVNGYDEESEKFNCIDSQFAINGVEILMDDLQKAYTDILYIRFNNENNKIDSMGILRNTIDRLNDEEGNFKIGKMIELFSEDLLNYMDLDKEVLEFKNNPSEALLFRVVSKIGNGRYKFSICLEYIQSINNDIQLESIIKMLQDVSIKWNEVFAMLVKSYFLKNREKILNRVYLKLKEIKNDEEKIVLNIKRILNDNCNNLIHNQNLKTKEKIQFNPKDYEFIGIKSYLNSNGVYKEECTNCTSELSNPNRYFVPKFEINNDEISIDKMKFKINNFTNDEFDNIACEGQEIQVDIEGYSKLMILMCSEFADFDEIIEIYYENKEKEIINFNTTSWLSQYTRENNQIAFPGKGVVREKDTINIYPFEVNLYGCFYNLREKSERIIKIKLPDCLNIHIFAITLCK